MKTFKSIVIIVLVLALTIIMLGAVKTKKGYIQNKSNNAIIIP